MRPQVKAGIAHFRQRAWREAHRALAQANQQRPLEAAQLELLALSAYFIGEDDDYVGHLERAHARYVEADEPTRAVRCAFWLTLHLLLRGDIGPASGWLGRARRIVEAMPGDCVESGYLLVPLVHQHVGAGESDEALAVAKRAVAIGERFGELELVAIARHLQGRVLLERERVSEGLQLLDEAMVDVAAGALPPLSTGLVYCSVIDGCRQVFAFDRARQWTEALTRWLADQPDMLAFTGQCLADRAEILQLRGLWDAALDEATRARQQATTSQRSIAASAAYRAGEIHRLRGELAAALDAYGAAGRLGFDPQPGMARLRAVQGRLDDARASLERALGAARTPARRPTLLAALVDVLVDLGALDDAQTAYEELAAIGARLATPALRAMAAHAAGALLLARGDAAAALSSLEDALALWLHVEAPYGAARARELLARCCRLLGDADGAALQLDAAHRGYDDLGAGPDAKRAAPPDEHASPLSPRELEVLRLVATGSTNRAIAAVLGLSVKTIDRHVSNIFNKIDVSTRAAATAYAYEHDLL